MKGMIMGMLAETPLHPGAGRTEGFVDLPVAREAVTNYPVIAGTSLKGSLRERVESQAELKQEAKRLFGAPDSAGELLISDGRLLLLPVRSLTTQFKWATCPHILERWLRDMRICGRESGELESRLSAISPKRGEVLGGNSEDKTIFLEEREFKRIGAVPEEFIRTIEPLILHERTKARLKEGIVLLHDDDFQWFARYGLPVNARNVLDKNKKSMNLWYEETIPPDTLLYALLFEKGEGELFGSVKKVFERRPYLQVGGDETVGMGWCAIRLVE